MSTIKIKQDGKWVPLPNIGVEDFPDAPKDGTPYARKDGTWVKIDNPGVIISTVYQDDSIADPANITGDVNGTVIQQIRAKFRRCLAKKTADGQMTIRYLKNDNSNFYDDGTVAKLDGSEGDVMVYFPRFFYKYESLGAYKFAISYTLNRFDSTWQESAECLVGAYEAHVLADKLYARSGVASTGGVSITNLKTYARARGAGYQLIDYNQHKMIAWLFYAIYGTRDCQAICGSGTDSYDKDTGQTNAIGNVDTTTANGNSMSVNFLALENCWGNKHEFIDNVILNPVSINGVLRITDTITGATRDVVGLIPNPGVWNYPKTVVAGEYLDIIAKEGGMSVTTGYADGQIGDIKLSLATLRSYRTNITIGGVANLVSTFLLTETYETVGSRLAFRGDIFESSSIEDFKAIPVTN